MTNTKKLRLACEEMGVELHSSDRFVVDAINWLTKMTAKPISIDYDDDDDSRWTVSSDTFSNPGETLSQALCGAIQCVAAEWANK